MPTIRSPRQQGPKTRGEVFDVGEAVTFQVAVLSNLISRPFYAQMGRYTGMTINDWRLILVIACRPGLSQTEIIHATGFNKTTVSRSLRHLKKYVRIEPHPGDNRKQAVYLTQDGWDKYHESLPALAWRQNLLTDALQPDELRQFRQTLAKLIANARQWADTLDDSNGLSR